MCEPLLGPLDLTDVSMRLAEARELEVSGLAGCDALTGLHWDAEDTITGIYGNPDPHVDWVVAGGESGPGARPMHPDWARALRDQCSAADVPFLFKQWGEWVPLRDYAGSGYWPTNAGGCCRLTAAGETSDVGYPLQRVGKKLAGRLLDGVEHNGYPS
jgi:hypothetical protein